MQTQIQSLGGDVRPSCKNPNDGAMASFTAATLALMSRMYEPFDAAYAATCLTHAQYAYAYASAHIGQAVGSCLGTQSYYGVNGNARNAWAICLAEMYWATGTSSYKTTALALTTSQYSGTNQVYPNNGYAFDYLNNGDLALYVLAQLGHSTALDNFNNLVLNNQLAAGHYNSENVYTRNGGWGVLRYPASAAFIIALYNKINNTSLNARVYDNIDYILGSNSGKKSFVAGFVPTSVAGASAVTAVHHRNIFLNDNNPIDAVKNTMTIPAKNTQFGALVGGVISSPGTYNKQVTEYQWTEVCIDYNAGLVAALGAINEKLAPVDTMKFYTAPCTATSTPTSVLDISSANSVNIYPNPFGTTTMLRFEGNWNETVKVSITDIRGNIVYSIDRYAPDQPLNLGAALSNGMYYVIVNSGDRTYTRKIVKGE